MKNETPSPEQIAITFSPVINTLNDEVITSAWEFIKMAYCYDRPQAWLDLRVETPKDAKFPRYQVFYGNDPENIVTYSLDSFADAISYAIDKAWEMVNRDPSCKYGIWEEAGYIRQCIEDVSSMEDHEEEDLSYWVEMLAKLEAKVGGTK